MEYFTLGEESSHPLKVPRVITGLWQLAGGHDEDIDINTAAEQMRPLVERGLTAFDMADRPRWNAQPAELVIGKYHASSDHRIFASTKWCPKPAPAALEQAQAAADLAMQRMGQSSLDLLQFHAWKYEKKSYLGDNLYFLDQIRSSGKIKHLGLTNTDLPHLRLITASGISIASNQVSVSVLDRRVVTGGMSDWCIEHGVSILAYGVLLGGLLSEKWVGKEEPQEPENASLRKYKRFIDAAGGWSAFQSVLSTLAAIARKHDVPISSIAIRHVLDIAGVSAVIIGSRLTPSSAKYIDPTLQALSVKLDEQDRADIAAAQAGLRDIPGDCGDEYRRPPFLTATGDLSDHLEAESKGRLDAALAQGRRLEYSSGSIYEPVAGYCRAVRIRNVIHVSGTTATPLPNGHVVAGTSAAAQTIHVLDIISDALQSLGGSLRDVVRTRIFLRDVADCMAVVKEHGRAFGREGVRPCNTTFGGARLIGEELLVEIEAEAILGSEGIMRVN